jgi:hypothetical protein
MEFLPAKSDLLISVYSPVTTDDAVALVLKTSSPTISAIGGSISISFSQDDRIRIIVVVHIIMENLLNLFIDISFRR